MRYEFNDQGKLDNHVDRNIEIGLYILGGLISEQAQSQGEMQVRLYSQETETGGFHIYGDSIYEMKIQSKLHSNVQELVGQELKETTLDINNRISVQYTVDDVERELGIFKTIQGPSKKDLEERKKMMKNYRIRREDLDN